MELAHTIPIIRVFSVVGWADFLPTLSALLD